MIIPAGVTSIGWLAFEGCIGLTSVTISDSETNIGRAAFSGCYNLLSVYFDGDAPEVGQSAFSDVASGAMAYVYPTSTGFPAEGELWNGLIVKYREGSPTIPTTYTITATASIGGTATGGGTYAEGATVTLTATPDTNYSFYGWYENDVKILDAGATYTFTATADRTLEASFTPLVIEEGDFEYTISEGEVTITHYNGSGGDVIIPGTIEGLPVTCIGIAAFIYCDSLISVQIPGSVRIIEAQAFQRCDSLTNVSIPEGVTSIGDSAFANCDSLANVHLPASLLDFSIYAFYSCFGLRSIEVSPNNQNYSSIDGVLFNKSKTELISFPSLNSFWYSIPDSVTSIGDSAFEYSSLEGVFIPDGVTRIGKWALGVSQILGWTKCKSKIS